jgi:nucleotide-binding universal stress UspA family protein
MYKKILVPIDGSPTANRGLQEALRLARHHAAKLRLLHIADVLVMAPTLEGGRYVAAAQQTLREDGERIVGKALALARKRGLAADAVMLEIVGGRAADLIVAQARKWRADLIVVGTHGRRGLSRFFMGSDAEQVVRTAPVPVLTVRSRKTRAR